MWERCGVLIALFWLLHGWCHVKLLPFWRTFCVHHTTMHQFTDRCIQSRICRVACVLSCNLPPVFWQDDQDLLCATAVTRGWNGYRNKSRHRKLTLEQKILSPFLLGLEPSTFRSRVLGILHFEPVSVEQMSWAIHSPNITLSG